MSDERAILFVCLGNICRSPLAEAAFRRAAEQAGLSVQAASAGTGNWHVGDPPDPRAIAEARRNGVDISTYQARQVCLEDFDRFDLILALDQSNLAALKAIAPDGARGRISLLLDHVVGMAGESVADPYFGEDAGFAKTWREVSLAADALVAELKR
jgi:protein-tyrosine phosphatase